MISCQLSNNWSHSNLSELTPYWITLGLFHLGSEASNCTKYFSGKNVFLLKCNKNKHIFIYLKMTLMLLLYLNLLIFYLLSFEIEYLFPSLRKHITFTRPWKLLLTVGRWPNDISKVAKILRHIGKVLQSTLDYLIFLLYIYLIKV